MKGKQRVTREKALIQPEWSEDPALVSAWCQGRTGYPFVDANMRELLHSGWMSNRGRQVVASFLIKDMRVDWRVGAEWFESRLLDYDVGSNWANWAYLAGVGGDPRSSRYFSVPRQQAVHDADGAFVSLWIPALSKRKQQPSILDAMQHVHLRQQSHAQDEEKAEHRAQAAAPAAEAYDCRPVVQLLHEAKRDEHGQLLLSKKQKRGGMAGGSGAGQQPLSTAGSRGGRGGRGGGGGHPGPDWGGWKELGEKSGEKSGFSPPRARGGGSRRGARGRGRGSPNRQAKQMSMDAFVSH